MKHDLLLINEIFTNYGIRHLQKHQSSKRSLLLAIGTIQTQDKHQCVAVQLTNYSILLSLMAKPTEQNKLSINKNQTPKITRRLLFNKTSLQTLEILFSYLIKKLYLNYHINSTTIDQMYFNINQSFISCELQLSIT